MINQGQGVQIANRVPFLDEASMSAVHWSTVWAEFKPSTPYGKREKAELFPFQSGQVAAASAAFDRLARDESTLSEERVREISRLLSAIPDIEDALAQLFQKDSVLGPKYLLQLKQFLVYGSRLLEATERFPLTWSHKLMWTKLLRPFADETPTFSVESIGTDDYRLSVKAHAEALAQFNQLARLRDREMQDLSGERPNREGFLMIPLPEKRDIALRLKDDARVKWHRDTPFESVFEVLPTTEMTMQMQEVEERKRDVDSYVEEALRGLCDVLRIFRGEWEQAVRDIAEVDLRVAKVALLRHWNGAIPQIGDAIQLENGVHPIVNARLARSAASYTPLTIAVREGANVLCGSNMGGKTVTMSLIFLCQCLAQYGMPVPAQKFVCPLFDVLRFASSAETDVASGLSSFGREIVALSDIWKSLTQVRAALVFCDEPGRSTNPVEGEALTIGLIQSLSTFTNTSITLFVATHFAQAVHLENVYKFRVRGLAKAAYEQINQLTTNDRLVLLEEAMDYRIEPLEATEFKSEALSIAEWLGLPKAVLDASRDYIQKGRPN